METKKCTNPDCLKELPIEEFDFQVKEPTKRYAWCNDCRSKAGFAKNGTTGTGIGETIFSRYHVEMKSYIANLKEAIEVLSRPEGFRCVRCGNLLQPKTTKINVDGELSDCCKTCLRKIAYRNIR